MSKEQKLLLNALEFIRKGTVDKENASRGVVEQTTAYAKSSTSVPNLIR